MIHNGCCGDSASNVLIDHNITTAPAMVQVNNSYNITNDNIFNTNASTIYNNAASNDFHLAAGSPAIGIGTSNGAPAVDFDGNVRGSRKCLQRLPPTAQMGRRAGRSQLTSRSPAAGTGSMISDVPNDYKGVARANPPCIGAFEYTVNH